MTIRKKRLLMIIAGALLCSVVLWFMAEFALQSDQDEYAKKCKYFEGKWKSKTGDLVLDVRRVSSGALFFSIENKTVNRKVSRVYAYAVGDDMYEFSYGTEAGKTGKVYKIVPGDEAKGTIHLQEGKIAVDFPKIEGQQGGLEYTGVLVKKVAFPKQKVHHLTDYLGTKKKMDADLKQYCSFGYDADGSIWRVHAMLAEESEKYKTDIAGISMNSTAEECENLLGNMTSEMKLDERGWRRQYENDRYVSTVIVNSFGVITELDCQLANLPGTSRQDDFIMKGNTVYRYAGDYSQAKTIELPQGTQRIASHAFDAGEHGYSLLTSNRQTCRLDIPDQIFIEEDAFANCGSLSIYLKSGRKEIPAGAFAHMVSLESRFKKANWVSIVLPSSLRKIGDRAFALGEATEDLEQYWEDNVNMEGDPVSIRAPGFSGSAISYIGDNAFWGIAMTALPRALCYLGKNYTLRSTDVLYASDELQIPKGLDVLKKDSLFLQGEYFQIRFPSTMRDIEEGSIRGAEDIKFRMSQDPENMKTSKEKIPLWILSKDGTILYAASPIDMYTNELQKNLMGEYDDLYDYYLDADDFDDVDDFDDFDDFYEELASSYYGYYKNGKDSRYQYSKKKGLILKIPKGVEEIRSQANLGGAPEIWFPSSVRKVSIDSSLNIGCQKIVFKGEVPQIYGDPSSLWDKDGDLLFGTIQVKKGQKKKLLEQLTAGGDLTEGEKKELASHITTF